MRIFQNINIFWFSLISGIVRGAPAEIQIEGSEQNLDELKSGTSVIREGRSCPIPLDQGYLAWEHKI